MERVVNVSDLVLDDIAGLGVAETLKIESNGKIIEDTWEDIPLKLSSLMEGSVISICGGSSNTCIRFYYNDKTYDLSNGNTRLFSLTRVN